MWNLLRRSIKMGRLARKISIDSGTTSEPILPELGQSLHIRHLDCGSCNGCDWEMTALLNPVYDIQRFGFDFVASPRHADVLMCTGPASTHLVRAARDTYEAMPNPKCVVAVGDCAINGGVSQGSYASRQGIGEVLPVQVCIPGCPPTPEDMINGLLQIIGKRPINLQKAD
ncbi:MAG: NADH-quinone oxidoreductase subunit NuoB [Desulfitobacterium hafniense]|nr:NADH-quinone oxidoreductase subunit NuoB [Desulfitobacterium hafniense]